MRSFTKDIGGVRDASLRRRVQQTILKVEEAGSLLDLAEVRKLEGSDRHYRLRVGEYRIGLMLDGDTVVFMRLLHRKDIYKYFP